jgi:hypothetical protein
MAGKRRATRCQAVEKLLWGRSAVLPLARKLNVPTGTPRILARLRLASRHPHDVFQQPVAFNRGYEKTRTGSMAATGFLVVFF